MNWETLESCLPSQDIKNHGVSECSLPGLEKPHPSSTCLLSGILRHCSWLALRAQLFTEKLGCSFSTPLLSTPMPSSVCRPTGGEIEAGTGPSLPRTSTLGGQKESQKRPEEHLSLTHRILHVHKRKLKPGGEAVLGLTARLCGAGGEAMVPTPTPGPVHCYTRR